MFEDMVVKFVVEVDGLSFSGYRDYLAFKWVKFHLPLVLPGGQFVEVFLQADAVCVTGNGQVDNGIIGEKTNSRVDAFGDIVDVEKKQGWADNNTYLKDLEANSRYDRCRLDGVEEFLMAQLKPSSLASQSDYDDL